MSHLYNSLSPLILPARLYTVILCSILFFPKYVLAGDHYNHDSFIDYIDDVSVYTSLYTQHFSPQPEHVNDQNMFGMEMQMMNKWSYGFTAFDNSFGQRSQYLYAGYEWNIPSFTTLGALRQYFKLTGGLVHGYKGEYEDKIPFNGLGVAPAVIPTYGLKYKNYKTEISLGGVSAFAITVGYTF